MASPSTTTTFPLQLGICRRVIASMNHESQRENQRRRRRRRPRTGTDNAAPQINPFSLTSRTVLIYDVATSSNEVGIILCKWEPSGGFDTESKEDIFCVDDSVRVIVRPTELGNRLPKLLDPNQNDNIIPWKHISKITKDGQDCSDGSHLHMTVTPISNHEDTVGPHGLLAFIANLPSPLLSITLLRRQNSCSNNNDFTKKNTILQQACHKRQLVGSVLIYDDNSDVSCMLTTEFRIPTTLDGDTLFYKVKSVTPVQKLSDESSGVFIILPSTQITILEDEKKDDAKIGGKDQLPITESPMVDADSTSPAAELLINTIHCVLKFDANIPRSFLFTGPPGVGKTFAVRTALARIEKDYPKSTRLISIQGGELLGAGGSNEAGASRLLEQHFTSAAQFCRNQNASDRVALIFLDECEALLSSETVAAMLGNLLDRVSSRIASTSNAGWRRMLVVGATNRIDAVPAWLRRPGRFDREVVMTPPDAKDRVVILESLLNRHLQSLSLQEEPSTLSRQDLESVAEACVGYVAADLAALVRRAFLLSIQESSHHEMIIDLLRRSMEDVGASALRDAALSAPPTTTWGDIVGDAGGAKTALRRAVEWPRTKQKDFASLGLIPPRGILLHGPPGCAKTTLARAAAGAAGIAFFSLSPADVYASSYVGEAEAIVRRAFTLARSAAPCILFFDEIDSILGSSASTDGGSMQGRGSSAEARVLSTFLNEMDGVDGSRTDGVLVLGATNRPCTLDAALLRPGRFDKVIYVPPPDEEGRKSILSMQFQKWAKSNDAVNSINVDLLANETISGKMTGAEIVGACREAAMKSLREALSQSERDKEHTATPVVTHACLEESLKEIKPLLSDESIMEEYARFEQSRQYKA